VNAFRGIATPLGFGGPRNYAEALKIYRWYTRCCISTRNVKLVQLHQVAAAECGFGNEVTRAPAGCRWWAGEREEVLAIIRKAMATRPK